MIKHIIKSYELGQGRSLVQSIEDYTLVDTLVELEKLEDKSLAFEILALYLRCKED